ncbi:unnamed protein product, partial [Amoebophrya sp. A120]
VTWEPFDYVPEVNEKDNAVCDVTKTKLLTSSAECQAAAATMTTRTGGVIVYTWAGTLTTADEPLGCLFFTASREIKYNFGAATGIQTNFALGKQFRKAVCNIPSINLNTISST